MGRKVIAFLGVEGSGKNYQCKQLEKQGYTTIAFADPLRKIAFKLINIPFKEGMKKYDELKQTDLINGFTFRNILEQLGEGIRDYDKNFWIKAVIKEIGNSTKNICISDMRYTNEYIEVCEWCKEHDIEFHAYLCDYHSERYNADNTHASAWLANYLVSKLHKKHMDEIKLDLVKELHYLFNSDTLEKELRSRIGEIKNDRARRQVFNDKKHVDNRTT